MLNAVQIPVNSHNTAVRSGDCSSAHLADERLQLTAVNDQCHILLSGRSRI